MQLRKLKGRERIFLKSGQLNASKCTKHVKLSPLKTCDRNLEPYEHYPNLAPVQRLNQTAPENNLFSFNFSNGTVHLKCDPDHSDWHKSVKLMELIIRSLTADPHSLKKKEKKPRVVFT